MNRRIRCNRWLFVIGLGLCVSLGGCGYSEASSESYALTSAFYSVCSSKNTERLEKFRDVYESKKNAGDLSEKEIAWIDDMLADATAGDWQTAQSKARRLMEAQVKPAD